jgi:hypothetical protein
MSSALRDFLEALRSDDGDGSEPPWPVDEEARFAEPWRSWGVTCGRIRQRLAQMERATGHDLERFLRGILTDEGYYRAELELDSSSEGGQLLRYVRRLLEEIQLRQPQREAEV